VKVEQQLAVARCLEPDLLELASDLVDDDLVEDRSLLEADDQHFAGILQVEERVLKRFAHAILPRLLHDDGDSVNGGSVRVYGSRFRAAIQTIK
jgi:hypothetical protein